MLKQEDPASVILPVLLDHFSPIFGLLPADDATPPSLPLHRRLLTQLPQPLQEAHRIPRRTQAHGLYNRVKAFARFLNHALCSGISDNKPHPPLEPLRRAL